MPELQFAEAMLQHMVLEAQRERPFIRGFLAHAAALVVDAGLTANVRGLSGWFN